jgi:hypothetical protein
MKQADVRSYAELNDFVPPERRDRARPYAFEVGGSVKDMIEALGVPHTEVDFILVNGESEDFSYRVRNGDRISVYPVFEAIDISPLVRLRPQPLREPRFVADTHLGRLAAYLRMLGFDTVYRDDAQDEELAQITTNERRILLTRDRGLLKRSVVTRGYCVRATNPREQLAEVRRFDLSGSMAAFQRGAREAGHDTKELYAACRRDLHVDRPGAFVAADLPVADIAWRMVCSVVGKRGGPDPLRVFGVRGISAGQEAGLSKPNVSQLRGNSCDWGQRRAQGGIPVPPGLRLLLGLQLVHQAHHLRHFLDAPGGLGVVTGDGDGGALVDGLDLDFGARNHHGAVHHAMGRLQVVHPAHSAHHAPATHHTVLHPFAHARAHGRLGRGRRRGLLTKRHGKGRHAEAEAYCGKSNEQFLVFHNSP